MWPPALRPALHSLAPTPCAYPCIPCPLSVPHPAHLPPGWQRGEGETARLRGIADYIAGMTDRFAIARHEILLSLEDVIRAYAADGADEDKGGLHDVRSTRRTASSTRAIGTSPLATRSGICFMYRPETMLMSTPASRAMRAASRPSSAKPCAISSCSDV